MENDVNSLCLILGHDFLGEHEIIVTINIIDKNIEIRVKLLSKIASADVIENLLDRLKG